MDKIWNDTKSIVQVSGISFVATYTLEHDDKVDDEDLKIPVNRCMEYGSPQNEERNTSEYFLQTLINAIMIHSFLTETDWYIL